MSTGEAKLQGFRDPQCEAFELCGETMYHITQCIFFLGRSDSEFYEDISLYDKVANTWSKSKISTKKIEYGV